MVNYPAALDNNASLLEAINILSSALDGLLAADANGNQGSTTNIQVASTANFPTSGFIIINDTDGTNIEVISYTSKDATHFIGITRGADGTITLAHATGSVVKNGNNAAYHNNLKDAVIAIETYGILTGEIKIYGNAVAPTGWLNCDGASYLKANYTALYAVIGDNFGSADGTHFNVPDFRDAFPRGTGTSTIFTDNTKGTRSASKTGGSASGIGSKQEDSYQGHWMQAATAESLVDSGGKIPNVGTGNPLPVAGQVIVKNHITDGSNGTPRTAPETRPKNIEVNFIIKY